MALVVGVMRRSGFAKNVARVICTAALGAPKVATIEGEVVQGVGQVRRSSTNSTFEPGFHWRKMIQAHHMSCCANLGNPPPREIIVEYCEDSEYTDYFIEIADKVEAAHPELAVLVSPNNMEARKGSFEIICDGHVIWSKLKKGRLPRFEDVLDGISELPSKCDIEPKSASA
jgi:selT/selW/selH-like putative selenoprotein